MTDLDPAIVDAMCIEAVGGPQHWHPLGEWEKDTTRTRIRAALLSLGIPAAALNAIAKGEADVVPKVRTREMLDARQMVHGFAPLTDARWQDIESCRSGDAYGTDAATLIDEEWSAMLAASPYRSEP